MKERIRATLREALIQRLGVPPAELPDFSVEVPNVESHGDFATNAAMLLAKRLRKAPRELAGLLGPALQAAPEVERVEVAGPGFLNVFLKPDAWRALLWEVLAAGGDYGRSTRARPARVMVEFVSANPTGPLHFGHGRGAVIGDVVARLLAFSGHQVQREFYVNDAGKQVRNLVLSLVHWLRKERGLPSELPADGYHGAYVAELAREVPAELSRFLPGEPDEAALQALERFGVAAMLACIQRDLTDFDVVMDRYSSERELLGSTRLAELFQELKARGVYEERDGARWFLSDRFGDEKPRVLVKSDGSHTYFANDLAYHLDKLRRGFERLINVWGADHHGYVPRMRAALQALGQPPEALEVILVQMVSLLRDGQPVVLSKRAGDIVTLREVFEEVGRDAARFFFLLRGSDSQMEFDLELAKRRSMDNPVYYVQYGHARLCSILARARERGLQVPGLEGRGALSLAPLALPEELRLVKKLVTLAEVVRRAADSCMPHQVVYFLQELTADFHSYYTTYGKTSPILGGPQERITARLVLVLALRQVVANALGLLGVSAPERMESLGAEGEEG
jgi:arginyl-tRNA synthetase